MRGQDFTKVIRQTRAHAGECKNSNQSIHHKMSRVCQGLSLHFHWGRDKHSYSLSCLVFTMLPRTGDPANPYLRVEYFDIRQLGKKSQFSAEKGSTSQLCKARCCLHQTMWVPLDQENDACHSEFSCIPNEKLNSCLIKHCYTGQHYILGRVTGGGDTYIHHFDPNSLPSDTQECIHLFPRGISS